MTETRNVQVGNGAVGMNATVAVKTRTELFMYMYEIAKEHRDRAKQVAGKDIYKDMKAEIEESMISILFSYTCLEAYVNTVGKDRRSISNWQKCKGSSTKAKWIVVSEALASKKAGKLTSIFCETKEPFKSFLKLKKIRNKYLVHMKPKFGDVVETKYGRTEGTINMFNCDKAEWACKTVKDMVTKLNISIDNPPSATWLV